MDYHELEAALGVVDEGYEDEEEGVFDFEDMAHSIDAAQAEAGCARAHLGSLPWKISQGCEGEPVTRACSAAAADL